MKSYVSLVALALVAGVVSGAAAQDGSAFSRDRNQSVTQRAASAFATPGALWGSFTAKPALTVGLGSDDNIYFQAADEKSDIILTATPEIALQSNWGRHSLGFNARVGVSKYSDYAKEGADTWSLGANGRLDVVGRNYFYGSANALSAVEPRGEELTTRDATKPTRFKAGSVTVGYNHEFNRLRLKGEVKSVKFNYDDVLTNGGTVIDQDRRDRRTSDFLVKGEYAVSPDTSIYALYDANQVDYDQMDSNGSVAFSRNSKGYNFAVGANFDLTDTLRGDVQVGYLNQEYDYSAFAKVDGISHKVKVEWFPTPLTTFTVDTGRSVRETPAVGASGYLSDTAAIAVDHQLRQNLIVSASYRATADDFNGVSRKDDRVKANVGATYYVSPSVKVIGGYEYSELKSSGTISGFKDNAFKISIGFAY